MSDQKDWQAAQRDQNVETPARITASAYPNDWLSAPSQGADNQRNDSGASDDPFATSTPPGARPWRPLLNRWLLTLNPGRTQDEYEKAVRYFFETPGVPQDVADVSADLLLAYRGALALRADRRRRSMPRRRAASLQRESLWSAAGEVMGALPGATGGGATPGAGETGPHSASASGPMPASLRQGPLSPATVNIRLTALRQFMLFVGEQQPLATLTPERVRSALRRLKNERRRPYQILAEDEWLDFLQAALGHPESASEVSSASPGAVAPSVSEPARPRGPWGVTRAARDAARALDGERHSADEPDDAEARESGGPDVTPGRAPGRARDGRTGARTAQRDHALISLALATGLRAIELSLLDVGDLVAERRRGRTEWWLNLPDEKTKGQRGGRSLPLAPELVATLLDYLQATGRSWEREDHHETPLFLALTRGRPPLSSGSDGTAARAVATLADEPERSYRRLRPEQIRGVIHRVEAQWLAQRRAAEAAAGEPVGESRHISPHALRHSAAIALLLGDDASERPPASVEHVRGWLGHFDIRTTQRYLAHIESRDQRRRFAIRPQTRSATASPSAAPTDTAPPTPAAPDAQPAHEQPTLFDDA